MHLLQLSCGMLLATAAFAQIPTTRFLKIENVSSDHKITVVNVVRSQSPPIR